MRQPLCITAVAVGGLLFAGQGCSSSSSSSPDQSASDVATALCNKIDSCAHFYVELAYGSASTCASRLQGEVKDSLNANGTGATPATLEACAAALPGATCDQVLGAGTPAACKPQVGTLADGTACGDNSQCKSTYCKKPANSTCGVCGEKAQIGGPCNVAQDCPDGSTCPVGLNSVCVNYAAAGANCNGNQPCLPTLVCKNGTCATPDQAGQMCVPMLGGAGSCSAATGYFCNPTNSTCQTAALAAAGATCGYDIAANSFTLCSAAGSCNVPAGRTTGTCAAAAADGASCNPVGGPPCTPPAVCNNGLCTLPTPSTCH